MYTRQSFSRTICKLPFYAAFYGGGGFFSAQATSPASKKGRVWCVNICMSMWLNLARLGKFATVEFYILKRILRNIIPDLSRGNVRGVNSKSESLQSPMNHYNILFEPLN